MKWISIENPEDLPPYGQVVLGIDAISGIITLTRLDPDEEDDIGVFSSLYLQEIPIDFSITHWMPLPLPPNEEKTFAPYPGG